VDDAPETPVETDSMPVFLPVKQFFASSAQVLSADAKPS
jgi:hypothetical protein